MASNYTTCIGVTASVFIEVSAEPIVLVKEPPILQSEAVGTSTISSKVLLQADTVQEDPQTQNVVLRENYLATNKMSLQNCDLQFNDYVVETEIQKEDVYSVLASPEAMTEDEKTGGDSESMEEEEEEDDNNEEEEEEQDEEIEGNSNASEQEWCYSCSSCKMTFNSIEQHIASHHQDQVVGMVVYEIDPTLEHLSNHVTEEMQDDSNNFRSVLLQSNKGSCDVTCGDTSRSTTASVPRETESLFLDEIVGEEEVVAGDVTDVSIEIPVPVAGTVVSENNFNKSRNIENKVSTELNHDSGVGKSGMDHGEKLWEHTKFNMNMNTKSSKSKNVENRNSDKETVKLKSTQSASVSNNVAINKVLAEDEGVIKVYCCDQCDQEFPTYQNLNKHFCMICQECGIVYKKAAAFQEHMATIHNLKSVALINKCPSTHNPVICDICDVKFISAASLKMHKVMHAHNAVRKDSNVVVKCTEFKCEICGNVCSSRRTLLQHVKVHNTVLTKDATAKYKTNVPWPSVCKICNKSFQYNDDLSNHWKQHVYNNEVSSVAKDKEKRIGKVQHKEKFTCPICAKSYSKYYMKTHMQVHIGGTQFTCDICDKTFTSQSNLNFHKRLHKGVRPYVCPYCKKNFSDSTNLKIHIRQHTGERPFACGFCGQRFSRSYEKVKHERIHTGERPYACKVCGMTFRVSYCLTLHMRVHTGCRPYFCEHCHKRFRTHTGYVHHIKIHSEERPYTCPHCPKTFKTMVQLAGHKNSHTKPYSCTECGRQFATLQMVRHHIESHKKGKDSLKFSCNRCGACYGTEYALREHLKVHHDTPDAEL